MVRHPPMSTLFPTRRSSDLILGAVFVVVGEGLDRVRAGFGAFVAELRPATLVCRDRFGIGRKSTRLNPSHMSISYHRFCLEINTADKRESLGSLDGRESGSN